MWKVIFGTEIVGGFRVQVGLGVWVRSGLTAHRQLFIICGIAECRK